MTRSASVARAKAASKPITPQLLELERELRDSAALDSVSVTQLMHIFRNWLAESEFGKSARLLSAMITEGQANDSSWLVDSLEEGDLSLSPVDVNRAVAVIDSTLGELELKELLRERERLMRDLVSFKQLKTEYSELKMPSSLTTRIERNEQRMAVLKKQLPDLDFPDICEDA